MAQGFADRHPPNMVRKFPDLYQQAVTSSIGEREQAHARPRL
jgi:hypothetical protein